MCSNLDHVTEMKSSITNKTISFEMMLDGKPVNTGSFRIKSLQGPGLVNVNLHDAISCLRSMPRLEIRVLIDGDPKLILQPVFLFMCVRITLDYCVGGGITTLSAKGLDEQKGDCLLRLRFRKKKRQQVYGERENVPEFVRCIGKAVLEEDKTELESDNKTCEAVAATVGDCCIELNELMSELNNDLCNNDAKTSSTVSLSSVSGSSCDLLEEIDDGQPSPGAATHTTAPSLTYKKPSVLGGLGEVVVIPVSGINENMGQPSPGPATPHNTALSLTYKKPSVLEGFGEVVVIPVSSINENMGQPIPGPATPHTSALSLTYKKPSVLEGFGEVVEIPVSGINENMVRKMPSTLIGFLCENQTPRGSSICDCLIGKLRKFGQCQITSLSDGFFAISFSSDESITLVLEHGQLFIHDKPLILKRWTQHLVFSQFLDSLPVWVRLYNLNWAYWSPENFSSISSMIGFPLFMDKCTANIIDDPKSIFNCSSTGGRCLDFARVCVEIELDRVLPSVVSILVNKKLIPIRVEYEWKPRRCMHCSSLCHDSTSCNRSRDDIYLERQDDPLITEDFESPEQVPVKTCMSPHYSDEDIPALVTDDGEYDGDVVESGPQSTELTIPESLTGELRDDVETPTSTPEVGAKRLRKFFKLLSRVLRSKNHRLCRSISL